MKNNRRNEFIFAFLGPRNPVILLMGILAILFGVGIVSAVDISDSPMETLVQSAAPNIMFVLDDSGSMDWEFMTSGTDGKFEGNTEYLFDNPGDNEYGAFDGNGTILTGTNRRKWLSQWYGHNKIFYNPRSSYQPWPGMAAASTSTPRSNPNNATPTVNLANTYMTLTAISGPRIIVDNLTNTGNQYAAEGNFFFSGSWAESTHIPEYDNSSLQCSATSGINEAYWTPKLTESGEYDVFVYWACNSGSYRDTTAKYTVNHASGATEYTVNQMSGAGQWHYLGSHTFNPQDAAWPNLPEVIVDNLDGSPAYLETGTWGESGLDPEWAGSSRYANSAATATWTPDIPEVGSYKVYAWWNCFDNRDTNAKYTIVHQTGSSVVYRDQNSATAACGQWVELGTWDFSAGTSGKVSVERHAASTYGSTVADAVKFVKASATSPQYVKVRRGSTNSSYPTSADAVMLIPPGSDYSAVNIKNAHYFMLDDTNNDGDRDDDENVYLVNLESTGRTYYQVSITDNKINEEVTLVTDPPDSIRPAVYDEASEVVEYVSAGDDLQNFANWYSFYRRRELSSKAAVSRSINELEGVRVGFYSINSTSTTGIRQPVLPLKLDIGASVIVDNRDSAFSTSGSWSTSTISGSYKGDSRYTTYTDRRATWAPNLRIAGEYKVWAWWPCYSSSTTSAKYTVTHSTGTTTVYKNQRSSGDGCGKWVELGTYTFNTGTTGRVVLAPTNSSRTYADAMYFEELSGTSVNVDETDTLLTKLYSLDSSGYTPLRIGFENVGKYFDADDGYTGNLGTAPFDAEADGGGCQQSFAILMTDGFYNDSFSSVGNVDSGMASPYGDTYSNTLADIAMKYYNRDLSTVLPNMVPTSTCDRNESQHLVTYSVSFGVKGTLTPQDFNNDGDEDDPCFLNDSTIHPVWPNPGSGDSEKIDDLWHAAVNGRGRFFSASDPQELVDSLETLFEDIASRIASGASVAVNGEELGSDTTLYQALYSSDTWTGDIYAYPMDPDSGEILRTESDLKWKASGKAGSPYGLQVLDWDTDRKIITYNTVLDENGSGAPFRLGNLSDEQKTALDSGWVADPTVAGKLVEYLRGNEIVGFRPRTRKLGDIVHSAPLLSGSAVYAGANDGMLHAFDKNTGREIFAYIPDLVFSNLAQLADLNYTHQFYVDSTAATNYQGKIGADIEDILVCGLGKGGKGYFALDITNVEDFTEDTTESEIANEVVLWEFPDAATATGDINDMGFSFSAAHIVKSAMLVDGKPRWVVIFGNGYNSYNGHAVLFIVDALDGTVVKKIDTEVGDGNGLSSPAVIDVDNDFIADYVYAGDLKGNLWKFDLTDSNPANWAVAYKEGTTLKPLFQATSQPITSRPDVMWHPKDHGFLVIFGTGIYLDNTHRSDVSQQTVYGIWDYGDDEDDSEYIGTLNHTSGALSYPSGISLVKQSVIDTTTIYDDFYRTLSNLEVQWHEEIDGVEQDLPGDYNPPELLDQKPDPIIHAGWFFDFPNTGDYEGERVIKDVTIRGGMVFVLSFIPNSSPCSGGGNSFFYILDPATGGRIEMPVMDINGDGKVDSNDLINIGTVDEPVYASPTGKLNVGMLHAPKFVKITDKLDKVIMSDSSGDIPVEDIEGESLGMYYWIER